MVKMGISTVSSKNALENMMIELPHWDFERVKKNGFQSDRPCCCESISI